MDVKHKFKPEDTYVFDEDVMDEMENMEDTAVLQDNLDDLDDSQHLDDTQFLDDVLAATVVLNDS